jgi:fatty acid desaturase
LQERLKAAGDSAGIDMRALTQDLAGYREPHHGRSVFELLITVVPLVLLWLSMWFALKLGYGIYLLLAVPAAGFMVRLFMIQHDTASNLDRCGGVTLRAGMSLALTRRGVGQCRK